MMDELKKCLSFQNSSVQLQALRTLHSNLVEIQAKDGRKWSSETKPPAQLTLLWELTTSTDQLISECSADVVIQMVIDDVIEYDYALRNLVNRAPSARSLHGILYGVRKLLELEAIAHTAAPDADSRLYVCPYGIRWSPHPYISLMTHRSDTSILLVSQIQELLHTSSLSSRTKCALLAPWLRYVLLEPTLTTPHHALLRQQLIPTLLSVHHQHQRTAAALNLPCDALNTRQQHALFADMIVKLIPAHQIQTSMQQQLLLQDITTLLNAATIASDDVITARDDVTKLIHYTVELYQHQLHQQDTCQDALQSLYRISNLVMSHVQAFIDTYSIISVCNLLLIAPPSHHRILVDIVATVVDHLSHVDKAKHVDLRLHSSLLLVTLLHYLTVSPLLMSSDKQLQTKAMTTLHKLQNINKDAVIGDCTTESHAGFTSRLTPQSYYMTALASLVRDLSRNPRKCHDWLLDLQDKLQAFPDDMFGDIVNVMTIFIASQCVSTDDAAQLATVLDAFVAVGKQFPSKVSLLVTVVMYCLKTHKAPQAQLQLLKTLPKLATHKLVISPILRTIQALYSNPSLRSVALRLLLELWIQDDRVYTHLHARLTELNGHALLNIDLLIAKAATIKDICTHRPELHGSDMLPQLSEILQVSTSEATTPAVVYALQALHVLCDAQVVDLRTVWSVLSENLSNDDRPKVNVQTCKLLSLANSLSVDTDEYKAFLDEVFQLLWAFTQKHDAAVISAAYESLAQFDRSDFTLNRVPPFVKDIAQESLPSNRRTEDSEDENEDEGEGQDHTISGDVFIKLLESMDDKAHQGMKTLLESVMESEVQNIPRGLHYNMMKQKTRNAANKKWLKALKPVPALYKKIHDQTKDPSAMAHAALCMMLTYTDVEEQDSDSQNTKKATVITRGRAYHQILYTLLQETVCDVDDWRQALVIREAWRVFMHHCYDSYLKCRLAELDLQLQRGTVRDLDTYQKNKQYAWLWARDKITDLIKSSSRSSAKSLANSVFALCGLMLSLMTFTSDPDPDLEVTLGGGEGHVGHSRWLNMATNSLLVMSDSQYEPQDQFIVLGNQRVDAHSLSSGGAARGHALMSVVCLVPVMMHDSQDVLTVAVQATIHALPTHTAQQQDSNRLSGLWSGLALGSLLGELYRANHTDTKQLMESVDELRKACYAQHNNKSTCIIGYGLCLSGMCRNYNDMTHAQQYVTSQIEQIHVAIQMCDETDKEYLAWFMCLGMVLCSAYDTALIPGDTIDSMVAIIYQAAMEHPGSGLEMCLGATLQGLVSLNHPSANQLLDTLAQDWSTQLAEDNTLQHLIDGLMAMAGTERFLFSSSDMDTSSSATTSPHIDITSLVTMQTSHLQAHLTHPPTTSSSSSSLPSWHLAHLYSSLVNRDTQNANTVPSSYSYLPYESLLAPCVETLTRAGNSGPSVVSDAVVQVCLDSLLAAKQHGRLPPLSWHTVLSLLLRLQYSEHTHSLVVKLALHLEASMFVVSWISAALWNSLHISSQKVILSSLPLLLHCLSSAALKQFCDERLIPVFDQDVTVKDVQEIQTSALLGLSEALAIMDPAAGIMAVLHHTLHDVYNKITFTYQQQHSSLRKALCSCMSHAPVELREQLTSADLTALSTLPKGGAVIAHLVTTQLEPLQSLNPYIEGVMYNEEDKIRRIQSLGLLQSCFFSCLDKSSRISTHSTSRLGGEDPSSRITTQQSAQWLHSRDKLCVWMLEIMGHLKNIATGVVPREDDVNLMQVLEYGMLVYMTAVVSWSAQGALSIPLSTCFHGSDSSSHSNPNRAKGAVELRDNEYDLLVLQAAPLALQRLLTAQPWIQYTAQVIDWLSTMREHLSNNTDLYNAVTGCMYALRHTDYYKKTQVWSRIVKT